MTKERLRPGFAMEEEPEEAAEEAPLPEPDPDSVHFEGMSDAAAKEVWQQEHICLRCLMVSMCKIAVHTADSMTTVTRCLGYIPDPKG